MKMRNTYSRGERIDGDFFRTMERQAQDVSGYQGVYVSRNGGKNNISVKRGITPIGIGGTVTPQRVAVLPPVATSVSPRREVFWLSSATGAEEGIDNCNGDDQIWSNVYPQTRWYPQDKYTSKSGIPV